LVVITGAKIFGPDNATPLAAKLFEQIVMKIMFFR